MANDGNRTSFQNIVGWKKIEGDEKCSPTEKE
jgi:hypothetical protein